MHCISIKKQKHSIQFHEKKLIKKTYKEWVSALTRFIIRDSSVTMKLLRFINDTCKVDFIKNITRQKRRTSSTKFNITGFEQNMRQSNNWQRAFERQ